MAKLDKLKPGQKVWEVRKQRPPARGKATFAIHVVEVNTEEGWVEASWNSNPPRRYNAKQVNKWRVNDPTTRRKL